MLQKRSKTLGIDSPAAITEKGVQSEEESFYCFFNEKWSLRQIDVRLDKHSAQDCHRWNVSDIGEYQQPNIPLIRFQRNA